MAFPHHRNTNPNSPKLEAAPTPVSPKVSRRRRPACFTWIVTIVVFLIIVFYVTIQSLRAPYPTIRGIYYCQDNQSSETTSLWISNIKPDFFSAFNRDYQTFSGKIEASYAIFDPHYGQIAGLTNTFTGKLMQNGKFTIALDNPSQATDQPPILSPIVLSGIMDSDGKVIKATFTLSGRPDDPLSCS